MLTVEENETLTRVGPGTPMGRLLRWYWHPIAASSQLDDNPVLPVKILDESLVLYRDRAGTLGLISDACAHRRVNLVCGIPEAEGLRCPYHGWRYDETGQCREMPAEPVDSSFPGRVKLTAYPVQELAGLVFAYLGPEPAPLLPRWDLFVCENVLRDVGLQEVPCNWLQMVENDMDPAHLDSLHNHFANYALERLGRKDLMHEERAPRGPIGRWEVYEQGVLNYEPFVRPCLFPNINSFMTEFMYRTPMDDTHTLHVYFTAYPQPPDEVVRQDKVPYYLVPPSIDAVGLPIWDELDNNGGQDIMAWANQGAIVDRTKEKLGESDRGIILYRDLLKRQLRIIEDGGEPLNVFRDPARNACIETPRKDGWFAWTGPEGLIGRRKSAAHKHSPVLSAMIEKYYGKEALLGPAH